MKSKFEHYNKYLDMTPEERRQERNTALRFWRLHKKAKNKQAMSQYRRKIMLVNEAEREVFEQSA